MDAALTIGQLAERAGTQPGTLRMWESRYGFPRGQRLASGHRRYSDADLEHVRDVLTLRQTGLSLPAAIERVLAEPDAPGSIFAGLRRRLPELDAHPLPKRLLLPMSNAIEDEASARGAGGLLVGSFQRERFYRQSERRWRLLAAPTELSFVLADFDRPHTAAGAPTEVPMDRRHPLAREWSLVWMHRSSQPASRHANGLDPSWPTRSASSMPSGRSSGSSSGRRRRPRSSSRGRRCPNSSSTCPPVWASLRSLTPTKRGGRPR